MFNTSILILIILYVPKSRSHVVIFAVYYAPWELSIMDKNPFNFLIFVILFSSAQFSTCHFNGSDKLPVVD